MQEFFVLSKLMRNPVRVASRLLQIEPGDMMVSTDFTTDSNSSLHFSSYKTPLSARQRIQLLVADLMLSGGFR